MDKVVSTKKIIGYCTIIILVIGVVILSHDFLIDFSNARFKMGYRQSANLIIYIIIICLYISVLLWIWLIERKVNESIKDIKILYGGSNLERLAILGIVMIVHVIFIYALMNEISEVYVAMVIGPIAGVILHFPDKIWHDKKSIIIRNYRYYYEEILGYNDDIGVNLEFYFKGEAQVRKVNCGSKRAKKIIIFDLEDQGVRSLS